MPVSPYTKEHFDSDSSGGGIKYPNPFFDLSKNYIPGNIKALFKYCHSFFHTDPFLSNVVRKLTEYPITELLYDKQVPEEIRKKYDIVLHERLKIKNLLIEIGLDYNTYGNCFLSRYIKFKRYLKDPKTGKLFPIDQVNWKWKNYSFWVNIGGVEREMEIVDENINAIEAFRIVRWNPANVEIKYNPISGERRYFYDMPNTTKNDIRKGDPHTLKTTPKIFIDAVKGKKKVEFETRNFYHFKRPGLSETNMGWGYPIILPAIRQIYYLQTLKKGNEAIANEHIVPKKAISPANTATLDPLTQMNLPKWTGQMEATVKKWRKDPNYIAVFPIPIGYQELGGNARSLMLTPEMKFIEENVINSLGVPIEFIKGGASWTGSSISLRIVENMFLTYRNLLTDFLNYFLIPSLKNHLGYPDVKLKFKEFRMSDDNASKQLLLQLAEMGKISDQHLMESFGFTYEEIERELDANMNRMRDQQVTTQKAQAEAQGESSIVLAKAEVRAQLEAQREHLKVRIEHLQEELMRERGEIEGNFLDLIQSIALQIMYLPPEQQIMHMDKLSKTSPTTYALVMETIEMYQSSGLVPGAPKKEGNPQTNGAPNQKSPGERESNKVKPRKKEKTKGNTRGEPRP